MKFSKRKKNKIKLERCYPGTENVFRTKEIEYL